MAVIARGCYFALRLTFETRFVSAGSLAFCFRLSWLSRVLLSSMPALTSRLCRSCALSALVFVEALPRLCLYSALVSAVDSATDSGLLPSHLASATSFARRRYSTRPNVKICQL